jgi:hypothetical protein
MLFLTVGSSHVYDVYHRRGNNQPSFEMKEEPTVRKTLTVATLW